MERQVYKEAGLEAGLEATREELALVNRLSRRELGAEEVYLFTLRLCDNEVDRDHERFSPQALEELAERFVGKSGLFDHQWSAHGQTARIYRTEVVDEPGVRTRAGDGYRYLKAWAYMLRTRRNRDLIAEIEGGIKREVSVGCAVERTACSICGGTPGACGHRKGETYGGKLCFGELTGVKDAYEWSFVAVPAQPQAGVLRKHRGEDGALRKAPAGREEPLRALEELEREAAMGRRYLAGLRREVVRLGALAGDGVEGLEAIAGKLDEGELLALKRSYAARVEARLPVGVQLPYRSGGGAEAGADGAFLV